MTNSTSLLSIFDKELIDIEDFSSFLLSQFNVDVSSIVGVEDDVDIIENTLFSLDIDIQHATSLFLSLSSFDSLLLEHKNILTANGWSFGFDHNNVPFASNPKSDSYIFGDMTVPFLTHTATALSYNSSSISFEDKLSSLGYSLLSIHPIKLSHISSGKIVSGLCAQFLISKL